MQQNDHVSEMALTCAECATAPDERSLPALCDRCGGVLLWEPDHAADAVPLDLGQGQTPVVALPRWQAEAGLPALFAKLEQLQPTGSFKDRGSAMLVARALALGRRRLVEDSSGNAGASMAAYAAHAGLACTVYAPAAAPLAKLGQALAYGAELRRVPGSREDVAAAAMADRSGDAYYAGHNTNPYFVHGMRSFADELIERFPKGLPEHIVMPVGGGSLYTGAWLGFRAARDRGRIERLPRLHLAQAEACAPLVLAAAAGADAPPVVTPRPTIAGGITIARPARGRLILRALRESRGLAVAVPEESIAAVRRALAVSEGLDVEPTSAVAFAALPLLMARGAFGPGEAVLVAVTGAGWKDPQPWEERER